MANSSKADARDDVPVKVIKPVFLTWVVLISRIPLQLNLTLVGGAVGGGIGFLAILYFGLSMPAWYPVAFFAVLFFVGTPLMVVYIGKGTYDLTEYKFYRSHLEYGEGFWNVENKIIKYHHVTQVTLRKSIIQRAFGLGTIILSVPSLGPGSGIAIADIRKPDKIYQQIQKIVSHFN